MAIGCHARYQPSHQEPLGVRRLAQQHAQGGIEPATLRLPVAPYHPAANYVVVDWQLCILLGKVLWQKEGSLPASCKIKDDISRVAVATVSPMFVFFSRGILRWTRDTAKLRQVTGKNPFISKPREGLFDKSRTEITHKMETVRLGSCSYLWVFIVHILVPCGPNLNIIICICVSITL